MLALYRKYRPQRFGEIFGQDHIKTTLRQEVRLKRIAHAYIFTGPRGTGKTSTARILAAAVNCTKQKDGEPCTACDHCQGIKNGSYIDLIEIDAASQTGVDNVRENIIEHARFVPQRGAYKVFIIDEAHMLSPAAWNALLKTLEEPPAHALFILATTEAKKIPETIVSRCQYFRFKPLDHDTIRERIRFIAGEEKTTLDDRTVDEVAARSGGYVRDAETLLGLVLSSGAKKIKWDETARLFEQSPLGELSRLAGMLLSGKPKEALEVVEALRTEGVTADTVLTDLFALYRALLYLLLTGQAHPLFVKKHGTKGDACVKGLVAQHQPLPAKINRDFQSLAANVERARNVSADIALEMAVADLCLSPAAPIHNVRGAERPQQTTPPVVTKKSDLQNNAAKDTHSSEPLRQTTKKAKKEDSIENVENAQKPEYEPVQEAKEMPLIALAQIQNAWNELIASLRIKSGSLGLILGFAKLLSVESGNRLRLGFTYRLHYEQCGQDKNRRLLEQGLAEQLNTPVQIEPVLLVQGHTANDASPNASESLLHNVIDFFGGKVVGS